MRRHFRNSGVFGVMLVWGFVWAVPGGLLELLSNLGVNFPITSLFDIWPAVLGIPGMVAGILFCAILWSPNGERRLDEWNVLSLGLVGALAGLIPGVVAVLSGAGSHGYPAPRPRAFVILGLAIILGAAASIVTAILGREPVDESESAGTEGHR